MSANHGGVEYQDLYRPSSSLAVSRDEELTHRCHRGVNVDSNGDATARMYGPSLVLLTIPP
ncbi:hypothetical protein FA13DRAFT_1730724 [Coprinellus micaceus]|uniref:Uncharacterized protein n=1 Tax=Coprinellus micaceus TaxID=71717 RepID=A0A4Y7THE4_COPMI|nr:hypothetical protein FA13DRAFT_1730724 [Coprinellus micaceus]